MELSKNIGRVATLVTFSAVLLHASNIDPKCSSTLTNMVAIGGAPGGPSTTFCISDYGWSNGWFATGFPGDYPANMPLNLLGNSAQLLSYTSGGTTYTSYLTPTADGKHTGSDFTIVTPVTKVGNDKATSVITDGRVNVTIDTQVINDNIRQTFVVTDISTQSVSNLRFEEYFNYFPFGVNNPNMGTMTYSPVPTIENTSVYGLWVDGAYGTPGFIRSGGVCGGVGTTGCTTPNEHEIGSPDTVYFDVKLGGPLNGVSSGANPSAGALAWNANTTLTNGQSQGFTVELVPEPETIALFLLGLAGVAVGRYKFSKKR